MRQNRSVIIGRHSPRLTLWVFAAALLLKAAMPFLASASAQMQGKALVAVCTVYGVSLVPLAGDNHEPAPEEARDHGGEHCALTALTALATADSPDRASAPVAKPGVAPLDAHPIAPARDASATWVARLKHGPPTFS
jgi:hypothetical protein